MFLNESKDSKANKKILFMIIPIVLLGMEMMNMLDCFIKYQTNFLQLLIDLLGTVSLLFIFPKNKTKKEKKLLIGLSLGFVSIICIFFEILWLF